MGNTLLSVYSHPIQCKMQKQFFKSSFWINRTAFEHYMQQKISPNPYDGRRYKVSVIQILAKVV